MPAREAIHVAAFPASSFSDPPRWMTKALNSPEGCSRTTAELGSRVTSVWTNGTARRRRIGVDADGRVIARHPGHRKLQSTFSNRSCLRTRPSRSLPLAGCQLTCLQQHRSTASLSKQHPTWPTNRAMLNQHALSIRLIESRVANRRHTQQISW